MSEIRFVFALVVLPALLLAINHSWLFARAGWLDPWVYSGYHIHLASLWHEIPGAYYGARLPWTVIGWIVYHVAGVEAYLYILALLLFYTSTLSLFYTIRSLFDSPVAGFIAACLLATNSWFLWSIGWHYIDGPIIATILLSFAALTGVARGRWWQTASVLWGAAVAATVALFSPNLVLLPVFAGAFLAVNYLGLRRPIVRVGLLWVVGFAGATIVMCLANWSLGGWFLFFEPQFEAAVGLLSLRSTMPPWSSWVWTAPWLLFPAFAFLASGVLMAFRGPSVVSRLRAGETDAALAGEGSLLALAAACLVMTLGFICMEAMRLGMLLYFYHANELWPFAFLVFGGCLAVGLSRAPRRLSYSLGIGAVLLCIVPWVLASMKWIEVPLPANALNEPQLFSGWLVEPLWMAAGGLLLVGVVYVRKWLLSALMIAFMSLLSVLSVTTYGTILFPDDGSSRNLALALYDIANFIDKTQLESGALPLWWDPTDRNGAAFQSLYEMMYLHYNPTNTLPLVAPGERVIFLSSDRALPKTAENGLANRQLRMLPIARAQIERGPVHIEVTIANITFVSASYRDFRIPLSGINLSQNNPRAPGASSSVRIVTVAPPWSYAAELQIPQALRDAHPGGADVRVRLRVEQGELGVGVTLPDGNTFIDRKFYFSSPEIRDIDLKIPALQNARQIVVTNGAAPSPSIGTIYSADVLTAEPERPPSGGRR